MRRRKGWNDMEEYVSDGSMEGMYRLFKYDQPRGTIVQFNEWFKRLCDIQKQVVECPWCGKPGELMVMEHKAENPYPKDDMRHHVTLIVDRDRVKYTVQCCHDTCPVQPWVRKSQETPEDAMKLWNEVKP